MSRTARMTGILIAAMLLAVPLSAGGFCLFACSGRNSSAAFQGTVCALVSNADGSTSRCFSGVPAAVLVANDLKISQPGVRAATVTLAVPAFLALPVGTTARTPVQTLSRSRLLALHGAFLI